jgi:hypothetical protein
VIARDLHPRPEPPTGQTDTTTRHRSPTAEKPMTNNDTPLHIPVFLAAPTGMETNPTDPGPETEGRNTATVATPHRKNR